MKDTQNDDQTVNTLLTTGTDSVAAAGTSTGTPDTDTKEETLNAALVTPIKSRDSRDSGSSSGTRQRYRSMVAGEKNPSPLSTPQTQTSELKLGGGRRSSGSAQKRINKRRDRLKEIEGTLPFGDEPNNNGQAR